MFSYFFCPIVPDMLLNFPMGATSTPKKKNWLCCYEKGPNQEAYASVVGINKPIRLPT